MEFEHLNPVGSFPKIMSNFWLPVLQIVCLTLLTRACIFKVKRPTATELKFPGPWNDESFERSFGICECGLNFTPGTEPTWNLYIRSQSNLCSGTIITSNLVATSHECVRTSGERLNIYDGWNISSDVKAFVKLDEIDVTSPNGDKFPVLQLIPNPQFLRSWRRKSEKLGFFSLDLLLIKVQADFTNHKELSPICIPEDSTHLDFVNREGYLHTIQQLSPANLSQAVHDGVIFTKKMCDAVSVGNGIVASRREKYDQLSGLCFRWVRQVGSDSSHPIQIGSPLFLKSSSHHSFLAGIAYNLSVASSETWIGYAHFSNILPMIKYLEYRAHQHNSSWCKVQKRGLVNLPLGTWPWGNESVQQTLKVRNESLDCVCGVPNTDLSGRVSGGVEAIPYEFGWMVLLNLYPGGRTEEKNNSFCGGSIINSRMILTAAHCMTIGGVLMKPENIDAFVNIHERELDWKSDIKQIESIIVHPDYQSMNNLDFDIALLVLKDELRFPPLPKDPVNGSIPHLRPVCLSKIREAIGLHGRQATVAGWGRTNPDDEYSVALRLQKIQLPVIPLNDCRHTAVAKITDRFICAGYRNMYNDSSQGDSGGPLSIMRGRQWTQVGIVSYGEHVFYKGKYNRTTALYTDLTNRDILPFIDFFAKEMQAGWCNSQIPD